MDGARVPKCFFTQKLILYHCGFTDDKFASLFGDSKACEYTPSGLSEIWNRNKEADSVAFRVGDLGGNGHSWTIIRDEACLWFIVESAHDLEGNPVLALHCTQLDDPLGYMIDQIPTWIDFGTELFIDSYSKRT